MKRNDNNMWGRSFTGAEGDYAGNGRNDFGEGDDETAAFSTIAASGTNSVNVDSVAAYIEYTAAGGGGGGIGIAVRQHMARTFQ